MTLTHYTPDETDEQGQQKGPRAPQRSVNGSTPYTGLSFQGEALGHSETVARRSRKGRSTFVVTRAHERRMQGADPVIGGMLRFTTDTGVTITGRTLSDLADAWIRSEHPEELSEAHGGARVCSCDDRTHPVLVLDRSDGSAPVYDPSTGQYEVRDVPVQGCHCGTYRPLLGTEARPRAYQQKGPGRGTHGADYLAATIGVDATRAVNRAKRRRQGWTDTHLARSYGVPARVPSHLAARDWAREESVIADALGRTDDPVVEIHDFPGVTVTIRRSAGSRMSVALNRGGTLTRFQARTASAIARRVIA
jgi:lambda repressor-like predicted transcriptional regulator